MKILSCKRITLYILSDFIFSFLVAFLFFFFIFFVNQLLVMAEEIFSKKVPFWDVVLFIIFSLPSVIALSFPFGSLVGALMTVGRLTSDNEILALKASGISLARIFIPLLFMGLLISLTSFVMNDYFLPLGNIRLVSIYRKILYTNPGIELEPYSIKRYEGTTIVTGNIDGSRIENIIIIDKIDKTDKRKDGKKRIIIAKSAFLEESGTQAGVISFRLNDVLTQVPQKDRQFEYTTSETMIYNILLKNISVAFINPTPREMSSLDVFKEIQVMNKNLNKRINEHKQNVEKKYYDFLMEIRYQKEMEGSEIIINESIRNAFKQYEKSKKKRIIDRKLQLHKLEFHKKYSMPIACLFFIVFAFPAGLLAKQSGRSVGFGIGLFMSALYWGLLFTGYTLGIRLEILPFFAMWFPNMVIVLMGLVLLIFKARQ